MRKRILWIVVDLTVAALVVLTVWIVNYKIPQKGTKAVIFPPMEAGTNFSGETAPGWESQLEAQTDSFMATNVIKDTQDWHEKFADKFTDTVVETDTSYTSPDLSVQLSYCYYDTGILDRSGEGKHFKPVYGFYRACLVYADRIICFGNYTGIY